MACKNCMVIISANYEFCPDCKYKVGLGRETDIPDVLLNLS